MTIRRKLAVAITAGVLVCAIAITLFTSREPVHKGKAWSQWLAEADYGKPDAVRREAEAAIREIGANMLPRLLADLRPSGSVIKWRLMSLLQRQTLVKLKFTTPDERCRRAYWGIHALGPAAKPIAADLALLFQANPGYALRAYASIGPDAIPVLTRALTHTNEWVRWNAASALWDFTPDQTREAVPLLVAGLSDTNAIVSMRMADVLRNLHPAEYERARQTQQR